VSAPTTTAAVPARVVPVAWRRAARLGPVLPALATVALLLVPPSGDSATGTQVTAADAASAVLVLCCALTAVHRGARPLDRAAAVILGAPALGFALATVTSQNPGESLLGLVRYAQIFVLVPAALVLTLRDRRDVRVLAAALVVLALAQGALGVVQFATGTGASYNGRDVRAVGTFGALDVMGMAGAVSFGLLLALAYGLAPPAGAPRWARPAALGCAAALLVPLALSFSRGAWIATAVAVLAVLLLAGPRTAVCTLLVVVAAAVVLVGGTGVGGRLLDQRLSSITQVSDTPDRSVTDRYALWAAAADIWRGAPVTGVGIKGFPAHRDGHASLGLSSGGDSAGAGSAFRREPLLSPHEMYLLVLSEQGLTGLTLLAGSWAALGVRGLHRLRRRRSPTGAPPARAPGTDCGLAACGLLLWNGVDFLYGDIGGPSTLLTALAFGLIAWWALSPAATAPHDEAVRR
jgi:O-antigen ligase